MAHSFSVGQPFSAFSLPSIQINDGESSQTSLDNAALAGQAFVLFIYPRDNTSGCTLEACHFRDLYLQFGQLGVEIVGLSRDTVGSHKNFATKQEFPFPLLADNGGAWLKENGLIYDAKMYGKPVTKVARTTIFVDQNGAVRQVWDDVSPPGHAAQVLEWVRENLG